MLLKDHEHLDEGHSHNTNSHSHGFTDYYTNGASLDGSHWVYDVDDHETDGNRYDHHDDRTSKSATVTVQSAESGIGRVNNIETGSR